MARSFNGSGDDIDLGSDASIDDFTQRTIALWIRADAGADNFDVFVSKNPASAGWRASWQTFGGVSAFQFAQRWDALAEWKGTDTLSAGVWRHLAIVYDGSSASNDPIMYVDGTSVALTETTAPVGTHVGDGGAALKLGELANGTNGFAGAIAHFVYDNTLWTAAEVNRHRWTGRGRGSSSAVILPMWTDKLTNEGSAGAAANGTATGTTVVAAAIPVVRPGMGLGI